MKAIVLAGALGLMSACAGKAPPAQMPEETPTQETSTPTEAPMAPEMQSAPANPCGAPNPCGQPK